MSYYAMPETKTYYVTEAELAEVENEYTYHAPDEDKRRRYEIIRDAHKQLNLLIRSLCPPSRERSLALTKLRQSNMDANASIAINER